MTTSGYTACACRDCCDCTVSSDMSKPELCSDCEDAGCDDSGSSECERSDADADACAHEFSAWRNLPAGTFADCELCGHEIEHSYDF